MGERWLIHVLKKQNKQICELPLVLIPLHIFFGLPLLCPRTGKSKNKVASKWNWKQKWVPAMEWALTSPWRCLYNKKRSPGYTYGVVWSLFATLVIYFIINFNKERILFDTWVKAWKQGIDLFLSGGHFGNAWTMVRRLREFDGNLMKCLVFKTW